LLIEFGSVVDALRSSETTPRDPEDPSAPELYRYLAACYAHMGQLDEAREAIARLRAITSVVIPDVSFLRNPEHRELIPSGLRLAAGGPACDVAGYS
jgi:hypothetical protein